MGRRDSVKMKGGRDHEREGEDTRREWRMEEKVGEGRREEKRECRGEQNEGMKIVCWDQEEEEEESKER